MRRVEGLARAGGAVPALEQRLEVLVQFHRPQRRLPGSALAHQQRIPEQLAQPVQRRAHGRLADVQLLGRPRYIAAGHQRIEMQKQIQVRILHGRAPINGVYTNINL
ncbi:hypothetical protein D3C85_1267390 [compost metagenome]